MNCELVLGWPFPSDWSEKLIFIGPIACLPVVSTIVRFPISIHQFVIGPTPAGFVSRVSISTVTAAAARPRIAAWRISHSFLEKRKWLVWELIDTTVNAEHFTGFACNKLSLAPLYRELTERTEYSNFLRYIIYKFKLYSWSWAGCWLVSRPGPVYFGCGDVREHSFRPATHLARDCVSGYSRPLHCYSWTSGWLGATYRRFLEHLGKHLQK